MRIWLALALLLTLSLVGAEATPGAPRATTAEARLFVGDGAPDGFSPLERRRIEAAVAAYRARQGQLPKLHRPFLFTFFPQAGLPGRDLFLQHFTDLDPLPDLIRDWGCSSYTYDGHRGHDSRIRSFREQEIGVPIFAAHDGVVIATHDGEPDRNTVGESPLSNYVVLDHGGGYVVSYGHLRLGSVAVIPGQAVAAGRQIGLTASSGQSVWPHLHLETQLNGNWIEPSAGPCHPGDSLWADQPPVTRELYAVGFYLSPDRLPLAGSSLSSHQASPDRTAVLDDDFRRAGSFVKAGNGSMRASTCATCREERSTTYACSTRKATWRSRAKACTRIAVCCPWWSPSSRSRSTSRLPASGASRSNSTTPESSMRRSASWRAPSRPSIGRQARSAFTSRMRRRPARRRSARWSPR